MSHDLEKLREQIDGSVYKERKFTEKEMKKLFRTVRSKEKQISWIPQTLTIIFTSAFLGIGGLYLYDQLVDGEVSSWEKAAIADFVPPSEALNTSVWHTIHPTETQMADFINVAYMEDAEFLADLRGPVMTSKSNGEDTLRVHRYTSGTDPSSHLLVEQWQTVSGPPEWFEKQMEQLETKEMMKVGETTVYLQNDGDINIGFFSAEDFAFFVSGDADIISLSEVEQILEHTIKGEDFSKMLDYEGGAK